VPSFGLNAFAMPLPTLRRRSRIVRSAAYRKGTFSVAKTISMGPKSGDYGARYSRSETAASIAAWTLANFVHRQISHDDDISALERGHKALTCISKKHHVLSHRVRKVPSSCAGANQPRT
jgi:hypothetical protein